MPPQAIRAQLSQLFGAAVSAVNPRELISRVASIEDGRLLFRTEDRTLCLPLPPRVLVIGAGKGAGFLAQGLEPLFGERIAGGGVILPRGQTAALRHLMCFHGEHPLPGPGSVYGTRQIAALLSRRHPDDLVCVCLTGGASSLLVSPAPGISLSEKVALHQALLTCGATIYEVNTVRKHLSQVKGGGLARWVFPNRLVSVLLSDVIDDDLGTIGSGPTAPDPTTFRDAWAVLERYDLLARVPPSVLTHLRRGLSGLIPETPKPTDGLFADVHNLLVGSNRSALAAAATAARQLGFIPHILTAALSGDTTEAAENFCVTLRAVLRTAREPQCVLAGGETTVRVTGHGKGGRNQEFALAAALALQEEPGWALLSAGTDGIDGPTDAAGAFVDGQTVARARRHGLAPLAFLSNNDTYSFFSALGDLFTPGPTGTNVMDIKVALVFPPEHPVPAWLAKNGGKH